MFEFELYREFNNKPYTMEKVLYTNRSTNTISYCIFHCNYITLIGDHYHYHYH